MVLLSITIGTPRGFGFDLSRLRTIFASVYGIRTLVMPSSLESDVGVEAGVSVVR